MKNYKHSVKSNNAMKLAAVASAAIMMAPVALNSVTSFAGTGNTATAYTQYNNEFDSNLTLAKAVLTAAQVNGSKAAYTAIQSAADDKGESATNWMNEIKAADAFVALAKKNGVALTSTKTFTAAEIGEPGSWYVDQALGTANSTTPVDSTTPVSTTPVSYADCFNAISADIAGVVSHFDAAAKKLSNPSAAETAKAATDAKAAADKAAADAKTAADLNTAQRALQVAMTNAQKSADALSSYKGENAATVQAFNNFDAAEKAAQAVLNSRTATPAAVNAATSAIQKAAVTLGDTITKATNGSSLSDAKKAEAAALAKKTAEIATAKSSLAKAIDNAKTSEAALSSNKGSNASTVAAFNAFDGVITAAQAVYRNANATPAALNAAAANVAKAATLGDTLAKNGKDFNNFKAAQNAIAALKALKQKIASTQTGVAHINYAKGYGIQIWTLDHKLVMTDATHAKKAMGGKNYKVFGSVAYINGKKYYNVGGNQYIDAHYVTFTATK